MLGVILSHWPVLWLLGWLRKTVGTFICSTATEGALRMRDLLPTLRGAAFEDVHCSREMCRNEGMDGILCITSIHTVTMLMHSSPNENLHTISEESWCFLRQTADPFVFVFHGRVCMCLYVFAHVITIVVCPYCVFTCASWNTLVVQHIMWNLRTAKLYMFAVEQWNFLLPYSTFLQDVNHPFPQCIPCILSLPICSIVTFCFWSDCFVTAVFVFMQALWCHLPLSHAPIL